jgi:hypothetical protein
LVDYGYEAHAAQTTNSYAQQQPKTSENWPKSFLHRSKHAKPDKEGACVVFRKSLSALTTHCFLKKRPSWAVSLRQKDPTAKVSFHQHHRMPTWFSTPQGY